MANPERERRRQAGADLVAANRILARYGVLDAYGHVSVRDPLDPERFLLARHMAPGIVQRRDLLWFGLDGEPLGKRAVKPYTERYIHAAIYAERPQVNGVVHSHSHAIIPFGVTGTPLRPIASVGAFLDRTVPVFDTQSVAGDTDLMVRDLPLGKALAGVLGEHPVALMRGHGAVAVGKSLREAVFRAIYTEINARIQTAALQLGGTIAYLTPGESQRLQAHWDADPTYRRPWEYWCAEVGLGPKGA